ncbi:MAG: squalene/phytoene synthase family protein [Luteolibacter sp.]
MRNDLGKKVLQGVSRSFYITLRLLPLPMRGSASLGYLLARISDTLADTVNTPVDVRWECLDQFEKAIAHAGPAPRWPLAILNALTDPRERHLLECTGEVLECLQRIPAAEAGLVREVLAVIVSGQKLDLSRFSHATRERPITLADDAELEDYTWRVAGCVGEFWTKLGFLTLGERFASVPQEDLLELGRDYGKGLQMVNILRDLPADLAAGRCYLPVADPMDHDDLLGCHQKWLTPTRMWIDDGKRYSSSLTSRRLRAATVLPALIAEKTLDRMKDVTWETLQARVKIPRRKVYQLLVKAFF